MLQVPGVRKSNMILMTSVQEEKEEQWCLATENGSPHFQTFQGWPPSFHRGAQVLPLRQM